MLRSLFQYIRPLLAFFVLLVVLFMGGIVTARGGISSNIRKDSVTIDEKKKETKFTPKDSVILDDKTILKRIKAVEKALEKAKREREKDMMRQDLTRDQREQLNERIQAMDGLKIGYHLRVSGGQKGYLIDPKTDSIGRRARFLRKVSSSVAFGDSLLKSMNLDSMQMATLPDSVVAMRFSDSLLVSNFSDSLLFDASFRIKGLIYAADSLLDITATALDKLTAMEDSLLIKPKFNITRDTIPAGRHTMFSLIAPGFGQVYNRQAWKLPILYGGVSGFLAGGLIFSNKHKSYKADYQRTLDLRLPPEIQKRAQARMRKAGSSKTLMFAMAGATYLYFVADAVFNYRGPVNPVRKATTLAAIFPGMGFVYTKTYWRIPIYYGGFIALATVVDYNGRSYQRYKKAYDALTDGNPSTVDEFNGRYSPEQLSNVRDAYRRDRDLAIIGLAGAYLLSIVDTYVIASLKNWDMNEDLSVSVAPTMIDTRINGRSYSPIQGITASGLAIKIRF